MTKPNLEEEKKLWTRGYDLVIGVDEVGRGAFAGPVVAGAVALAKIKSQKLKVKSSIQNSKLDGVDWERLGIDDSKRLTSKKREQLQKIICRDCLSFGIGKASVHYINRYGIVKATEKAMRGAINSLREQSKSKRAYVLVDAFYVKYVRNIGLRNQKAIIKGDQKSISIAAASIVAKVHRDKMMTSLSKQFKFKKYHWEKNKGYGTKRHREAIRKSGASRLHRLAWLSN